VLAGLDRPARQGEVKTMRDLTTAQKIRALVDAGLADDAADARAMLIDMGEIQS